MCDEKEEPFFFSIVVILALGEISIVPSHVRDRGLSWLLDSQSIERYHQQYHCHP